VATPLERQFGRIAGVNQMTSSSSLGSASVTLQFDINRNIDAAAATYRLRSTPRAANCPAICRKIRVTARQIRPKHYPHSHAHLRRRYQAQIYDLADSILAQKLSQIQGWARSSSAAARNPLFAPS